MSQMQQFLYRIQATRPAMLSDGPTAEEEAIVGQHIAYLRQLAERDTLMLAGRTQNVDATGFGLVIFRAESEAVARRIMTEDPAVRQGVMTAELFPYKVAVRGTL